MNGDSVLVSWSDGFWTELDGWYEVTVRDIKRHGGRGMMEHYGESLVRALSAVYPHHHWLPWKFKRAPAGFWDDRANQRWFFDWVASNLGITGTIITTVIITIVTPVITLIAVTDASGWYGVSKEQVVECGGGWLLQQQYDNSLFKALSTVYSDVKWIQENFNENPRFYHIVITAASSRWVDGLLVAGIMPVLRSVVMWRGKICRGKCTWCQMDFGIVSKTGKDFWIGSVLNFTSQVCSHRFQIWLEGDNFGRYKRLVRDVH